VLIVEDDIEEGTVHVHPAVVVNEAQFAELIHEVTDAGVRAISLLYGRVIHTGKGECGPVNIAQL